MALLINNKFIFFHVYKVCGTSVRSFFNNKHRRYRFNTEEIGLSHCAMSEIARAKLRNYFKFTFVRNPYDWLVSLYFHITTYKKHILHKRYKEKPFEFFIKDFLHNVLDKTETKHGRILRQSKIINRPINFIGHFETFREDFISVIKKISPHRANINIPHLNISNKKGDASTYYTAKLRKYTYEFLKDDFDKFGYNF